MQLLFLIWKIRKCRNNCYRGRGFWLKKYGASVEAASFVLPLGATINLDGTATLASGRIARMKYCKTLSNNR